jgi:HK97 family phage portal protein
MPPVRDAIPTISVDTALSIGAAYRCVSIITSSISQMPLAVYRDGLEIKTPTIIKQPNVNESQRAFVKQTVWSLATHGNAYWRVYGTYPNIQNLEVLDPSTVTVTTEDGRYKYWVGEKECRADQIKHLRLEPRPGNPLGIGPIQRGQNELIGALRLKNFADGWFGTSGVPVGVLTTDQTLSADDAAAYAAAWNEFIRTNGTAVLGSNMRYEYLNLNPVQAQYLEVSQSKTIAIARLFGVPATLLASGSEGSSNTYINQQELFMQFLQTTLVEYMNEIEDAFSSLLPRGQEVNFKEDTLLRMNSVLEAQVQTAQISNRTRTPNELRAADGLAPLPGGDEFPTPVEAKPNPVNEDNQDGTD